MHRQGRFGGDNVGPVFNRRGIWPHRSTLGLGYRLGDAIVIAATIAIVSVFSPYPWTIPQWGTLYTLAGACGIAVFYLAAEHLDLYAPWRGASVGGETKRVCLAWGWVVLILSLLGFATKTSIHFPRSVILSWFVMAPVVLVLWRGFLRLALDAWWRRKRPYHGVAIYGCTDVGSRLRRKLRQAPWMGLALVGFYDDRDTARVGSRVEGTMADLVQAATQGRLLYVFIALPMRGEGRVRELLAQLEGSPAAVYVVPDLFAFDLLQARMLNIDGIPAFSIFDRPQEGLPGWLKRGEDVFIGSILLVILAVPMLLIALLIRMTSPGPVIFKQRRYGLDGKEITIWKFRTMTVCEDGVAVQQATRNDPRVTRLGLLLRRTSLDELPQIINVIQGHMSLVGPRPHPLALDEAHRRRIKGYMLRHRVRPGMTGLAQINGWRGETDTLEKMQARVAYDLEYISNWSLWLDLKILAKTMVRGFGGANVY